MTRKDYIKLAAAFAVTKPQAPQTYRLGSVDMQAEAEHDVWRGSVHAVADVLQADNPRFDRARFLKAAGVLA